MATRKSQDKHYSEHTIDTEENNLNIKNTKTTHITSNVESDDFETGSLIAQGGAVVKKTLRAGNLEVTGDANIGNIIAETMVVSSETPTTIDTLESSSITTTDLVAGNASIGNLTLTGNKHIDFEEGETYSGRRFFGWQSFTFAKGDAIYALHPYSFKNFDSDTNFNEYSNHVIKDPQYVPPIEISPGNYIPGTGNVAGIDEDGVFMPPLGTTSSFASASVVLELNLNTYFSSSGATNSSARIYITSVDLIFKDTDNLGNEASSTTFCRGSLLYRQSLILPGDLQTSAIYGFYTSDLNTGSYSAHSFVPNNPIQIAIGNYVGNICTLRVNLITQESTSTTGPRFIGAYVGYTTNQITPS